MTEVQSPPHLPERTDETGPSRRFPWRAIVASLAVLMVAAGVTTWLVLAHGAELVHGPMYGPGRGVEVANDGVTDTRYVVKGAPGKTFSLTTSVANPGRAPIAVEGIAKDVGLLRWIVGATYVRFEGDGSEPTPRPLQRVILDQHEWIAVELTFRVPRCWPMYGNGYTWQDTVRWRTRALGVGGVSETTMVVDTPLTVVAQEVGSRPTDCPPLGG